MINLLLLALIACGEDEDSSAEAPLDVNQEETVKEESPEEESVEEETEQLIQSPTGRQTVIRCLTLNNKERTTWEKL